MKRQARTILEYLSVFMLITLLLLAIVGVVVVKFYGEELQEYVIEQVNNRIDSTIDVKEVSVRVFHKFPNTSILLEDITIWSSHNFDYRNFEGTGSDTLLTAETLSLSFNLFGLMRKKFNVRQLELKNGTLHLYTDKSGEGNYKMITKKKKGDKNDPLVNLSQLRISDFSIILNNQAKQLTSISNLKRLDLNGKFSRRNTQIKGSLTGFIKEISNKGILYASERDVEAKLNLDVQDSLYTIKNGQLRIDRILADMDGQFQVRRGVGVHMDLYAAARDLEIHEVLDLLPSEMSVPLLGIRGNGGLQLYSKITGLVSSTLTPQIEADFQTSNANLQWDRFPFSLKNLNLTGTYSNGGEFNPVTASLIIESLSAVIGKDHLSGRGRIRNFLDPDFSFDLKGDIHPEQWIGWYEAIPVHQVTGTVISDIKVTGSYDRQKPRGEKLASLDVTGGVSLEDVMVKISKKGLKFSDLNGTIFIDNDFWEPSLSGNFGKSDFIISGSGLNLFSFLLGENETLVASASLQSKYIDLQDILDNFPGKRANGRSSISFPEKLDLKLDFVFNEFHKDPFKASNVRGRGTYEAHTFYIDSLSMQTMDGVLMGNIGLIQNARGEVFTTVNATPQNLDIRKLFDSFNNFGQKQVTGEHLKGTISGTSIFSADFDSTFALNKESILSENIVTITDGELNGFAPLLALSRFIEVEELQNIKFETLENTILIKESQVIIPAMDIYSNAINLSASGTHGFDNNYDYRLKLKLSDLLYNKTRGSKREEFEIAEDESDTRTLFLKIYNEGTEATVEVDREKTAEKIRNDLKEEKKELKNILNKELGLYKNDVDVKSQEEEPEEGEIFKFEFSDEPDTSSVPKKTKEKRFRFKKRSKTDTVENKPAVKFVIDE